MLKAIVRSERIAHIQRSYRELETRAGLETANQIRQMRSLLDHASNRFNTRQRTAAGKGAPYVPDGRISTLERDIFDPIAAYGWPSRIGAIFHGLRRETVTHLSDIYELRAKPQLTRYDRESYLCVLQDGPAQARSFGDLVAIAMYFAPFEEFEFMWIGPESDVRMGCQDLIDEAASDWRSVNRGYWGWLQEHP